MEEIKSFDVYKATNKLNGKYYIGVTTQGIGNRMKNHRYKALSGSQYSFHKAIRDFGLESFTVEVIDSTEDIEEAKQLEKHWIEKLHSNNSEYGYNSDCGGDLMFHTNETKAKISAIHKGKDMSKFYTPILQYSLDGKFICEYKSMTEAQERTGICRAAILRVIRKTVKTKSKKNPYIWVYKTEYPTVPLEIDPTPWNPKPRIVNLSDRFVSTRDSQEKQGKEFGSRVASKPVIQCDKDLNILAEYESIGKAAKESGVSAKTIVDYCNGVYDNRFDDEKFLKRIRFIWRYKQ